MNFLSNYSPVLEQLSIDECFLDMTGTNYLYDNLIELAYKIKDDIKEKFGYTVNIGVGNNKLCAKMASDFEKPDKVHTLFSTEIEEKMWPLAVDDLYMCGKSTSRKLKQLGIKTIGDLAKCDQKLLEKHFKSNGVYLKQAALGIDNSKVGEHSSKNPSISISETLPYNYSDLDKIKNIVFRQVEEVSRELRSKGFYARTITVILKDDSFRQTTSQETLDNPTNQTKDFLITAYQILDSNYHGEEIRLIGVKLSNLSKDRNEQINIFSSDNKDESNNIQQTIDIINNKFGKSIIKPASLEIIGTSKSKKSYKDNDV